jgi:hypothetical protein
LSKYKKYRARPGQLPDRPEKKSLIRRKTFPVITRGEFGEKALAATRLSILTFSQPASDLRLGPRLTQRMSNLLSV